MADRKSIFTSTNLSINAIRVSELAHSFKSLLPNGDNPLRLSSLGFIETKENIEKVRNVTIVLCDKLNHVNQRADVKVPFLDESFTEIKINRTDTFTDVIDIKSLFSIMSDLSKLKTISEVESELSLLQPYESRLNNLPANIITEEDHHLNILHDLLDALSYELQGRHSNTGEQTNLSEEIFVSLINDRLTVSKIYLSNLPESVEKNQMVDLFNYVESDFQSDPASAGETIDQNWDKLVMIRRWWAL